MLEELRSIVLALPGTTEGTHFRLTAFFVAGKGFVTVEKDQAHVMCRLEKDGIGKLVKEAPGTFEEVWQSGKSLIGVRFRLADVPVGELKKLIESSWRTKAPGAMKKT